MRGLVRWPALVATLLVGAAIARPQSGNWSQSDTTSVHRLMGRQMFYFDYEDLGYWINSLSAIGDSYSAGIGAGDILGGFSLKKQSDYACRRYDGSYPRLVWEDERLDTPIGPPVFEFKSCSGAVAHDVLHEQIPYLSDRQDAILLSVGGNDAELVNILNSCVYQWANLNKFQAVVGEIEFGRRWKKFSDRINNKVKEILGMEVPIEMPDAIDFEKLSRTCDEQLSRTEDIVDSEEYSNKLEAVVHAAKRKLDTSNSGRIYWTGYAKFFGTDYDSACDQVSWTSWIHGTYAPGDNFHGDQKLLVSHRKRMNDLVDKVNAKLRAIAKKAGESVVFVDYDHYLSDFKGRFCEKGVNEHWDNEDAKHRPKLMFYEMNGKDIKGEDWWKRSAEITAGGTFESTINLLAMFTEELSPDSKLRGPKGALSTSSMSLSSIEPLALSEFTNHTSSTSPSSNRTAAMRFSNHTTPSNSSSSITSWASTMSENGAWGLPNFVPDGYGRVFHPTKLLHSIIANLVVWNMMNEKAKISSRPPLLEDQTFGASCSLNPTRPDKAPSFYARILPLGASIVTGWGSTPHPNGHGFRKPLRDALRQDGWKVNMVGSRNIGPMVDNDVEGHPGYRVDQITVQADNSIPYQPNIVVINAGTNDANQDYKIAEFKDRYKAMLDKLQEGIPGVTIIVSTLIQGTLDGIRKNRDNINNQIRELVRERRHLGQKIILADVDHPSNWIPTSMIPDGTHPNDEGHRRLAAIFHRAIKEAHRIGFITRPRDTGESDEPGSNHGGRTCDKVFGSGSKVGSAVTQGGSGLDDGIWGYRAGRLGGGWTLGGQGEEADITFARLAEPFGRHDLVVVAPLDPSQPPADQGPGWFHARKAVNGGWSSDASTFTRFSVQDKCVFRGIRFADINGDGLDDLLCIAANGDTFASINKGNYSFSSPRLWKANVGPSQSRVRLADIDGDGRKDYCVVEDNGDIKCWRNGGQGDYAEYWQALGVVFTGKGMGNLNGVFFADINGDGRDDWHWMDEDGAVWTWVNNRGCSKGSLKPLWREASASPSIQAPSLMWPRTSSHVSFHLVNSFNTPGSFGLGPRLDYVTTQALINGTGQIHINVRENAGAGGAKLKADGDRYCKMMDRPTGAMDYVWIHSTGYLHIYESFGGSFPSSAPYWGPNYIFWRATNFLNKEVDRRDIHLADWDGDGLCDIIYVNPDTGAMDGLWLNKYKTVRDLRKAENWQRVTNAGPRGEKKACPERRGIHINDIAVRFADIDGNGRADYLCVEKDGRTWGYLNTNGSDLTYISQFKKTEGKDRANLKFVDVNGDGKADMLWVNKFNGDASVWYNRGQIPNSGSAFTWEAKGAVYQGAAQGHCEHFPDLDGNGRADMHVVDSLANTGKTWWNKCPGEGSSSNGDDSDTLTSPKLPNPV
ncbi:SGNH hydrolase-type esterase domain-containing protein [Podospora fimiseda]|uniref:SGNH hydrolase-type esterase domain-containing protein n=1 Tax=Podospora fimiseda TaxID=252190 RepID=A0AAN6YK85_9PEZI|nr:SGNH hydrolase-type esterase domain-containing protein [Podospora fimiseda]